MSGRHFYVEDTKKEVAKAVARIEQGTGAEVMVVIRPASDRYRHVDYLVGAASAMVALLFFLFHDAEFRVDLFPLEAAFFFAAGALVSANLPDLRRLLLLPRTRAEAVRRASHAAMFELGVTRTRARVGVLVYVSLFERKVAVVPDVGLEGLASDPEFRKVVAALDGAVHPPDVPRFVAALDGLGPILSARVPRSADDVNELSDEMHIP